MGTETLSRIRYCHGKDVKATQTAIVPKVVRPKNIIRMDAYVSGNTHIDWRRSVVSIADDESLGSVMYVGEYYDITMSAALLFVKEAPSFTTFGRDQVKKMRAIVLPGTLLPFERNRGRSGAQSLSQLLERALEMSSFLVTFIRLAAHRSQAIARIHLEDLLSDHRH